MSYIGIVITYVFIQNFILVQFMGPRAPWEWVLPYHSSLLSHPSYAGR